MKKICIAGLALFMAVQISAQVKPVKIDRTQKPKAGAAPVVSFKDPTIFTLPNGMTVLVVENHKLPKVRATLTIDAGPIKEGDKAGTLDMLGEMLEEGTTNLSKEKYDEAIDALGADVNVNANGGTTSALTRYFEKAFGLMADAIKNPLFPAPAFDKVKARYITGLKANEKSTPAIASRVYQALSYGKNTAQGEITTETTAKSISLDDVKKAYQQYITPSRSYLTLVGDINPITAKALVTKIFGNWTGRKLPVPAIPLVQNPAATEIDFIDIPTAVQGEINIGNLINNPLNSPDYHALLLANYILGGGAESKLFMNLREKHGFTYGSYSEVGRGRFQTLFTANAAVRTEKVDSAVAEVFSEILHMRDGLITEEELSTAKALYNGNFALSMEDPATTASFASNILINGLPKDFYKTFLQKINAVTLADIKRVSKTYFSESNSRIVIAGNGSKILPKLMRLGYVIKKYDKYADPVIEKAPEVKTEETPKTTNNISAYEIVESYLKAIGGKEELKKVTSLVSSISLDMMGRTFEGTDKRSNPNLHSTEIKMGSMTVMKSVYDGKQGYQQQGPQKKEMDEKELKEAQDEKGVIPQLFYMTDATYKTEYLGTGKVNDDATYRLKVTMPSGSVSIQEYSTTSGLLLKEEITSTSGEDDATSTVEYKDYKKVGAILLPHEITRNQGGMEFTIKISGYKINEALTEADFK